MTTCQHCCSNTAIQASLKSGHLIKSGTFPRKGDQKAIQRYYCKTCCRKTSSSTYTLTVNLKLRNTLKTAKSYLIEGTSIRGTARSMGIDRETVMRRFHILNEMAKIRHPRHLNHVFQGKQAPEVYMDELVTFLGTKLKGISVSTVVTQERLILGFEVVTCPPHEVYLERSIKKFGVTPDLRPQGITQCLDKGRKWILEGAKVHTDKCIYYPESIAKTFPKATHVSTLSRKARAHGLGELKGGGFDPLFQINHVFALFRARLARLARKTWCTTKSQINLEKHIRIFAEAHNRRVMTLLAQQGRAVAMV